MVHCKCLMVDLKLTELIGQDSVIHAPFSFNPKNIIAFRQSISDEGELEPYTLLYSEYGDTWCIDIPYEDYKKIHLNHAD